MENLLNSNLLISNSKSLDAYYENNLNTNHLDERFSFRVKNLVTPSKLAFNSPLSQKSMGIARSDSTPFKKFTVHKMLNYDVSDHMNISSNLIDIVNYHFFNSIRKI